MAFWIFKKKLMGSHLKKIEEIFWLWILKNFINCPWILNFHLNFFLTIWTKDPEMNPPPPPNYLQYKVPVFVRIAVNRVQQKSWATDSGTSTGTSRKASANFNPQQASMKEPTRPDWVRTAARSPQLSMSAILSAFFCSVSEKNFSNVYSKKFILWISLI